VNQWLSKERPLAQLLAQLVYEICDALAFGFQLLQEFGMFQRATQIAQCQLVGNQTHQQLPIVGMVDQGAAQDLKSQSALTGFVEGHSIDECKKGRREAPAKLLRS